MKTKNVVVSGMLLGGVLLASAGAKAESLEDQEKWARQDSYMESSIKDANTACGTSGKPITNQFDKASFAKEDWSSHSPNGYCSGVFDNLRSICANVDGAKQPVQNQIKKVVCRYAGKGKFGMSLANGTLTYNVDWDEPNVDDKIAAFIKKNLTTTPAAGGAAGESVADKEKWARQDSYMASSIKDANAKCGTALTNEFDKASFAKEDWTSHSPNGYCSGAFDNIRSLCANNAAAKKPVQQKIKKVVCKYAGKGKFGMTLAGGTLTYNVDWDQANVDDKITSFLKKNL
ncbi:MAG: hypothetical protein KF795_26375 [Labilithrix sp.]|nr:hypothetical protein [Labilithrix sp.]